MLRQRLGAALLLSIATSWLIPGSALADDLDDARAMVERAEFAAAIDAFDRVDHGDGLDRDGAVRLLEGRALAAHAARRRETVDRDLRALLSLEPLYRFDERAPPSLRSALEELRESIVDRVDIVARAETVGDAIEIRTELRHDVASLVRAVRVYVDDDAGGWTMEERAPTAGPLEVAARPVVRYRVEAIGPGGAVVAHSGTIDEPRVVRAALGDDPVAPPSGGDDTGLIVGLTVGAVVLVAAAVIVSVLFVTMQEPGFQLSIPMEAM
ncbi:MAG: hypothetical protein AB7S26_30020 [Sandaracinaceae bacterium]